MRRESRRPLTKREFDLFLHCDISFVRAVDNSQHNVFIPQKILIHSPRSLRFAVTRHKFITSLVTVPCQAFGTAIAGEVVSGRFPSESERKKEERDLVNEKMKMVILSRDQVRFDREEVELAKKRKASEAEIDSLQKAASESQAMLDAAKEAFKEALNE